MHKWNMTLSGIWRKLIFYMSLVLMWELVYRLNVDLLKLWKPYIFPSPEEVLATVGHLISDQTLLIAAQSSLIRLVAGYALSLVIGALIGILMIRYRYLDENMRPVILGLQTLPTICWIPFAILWYGLTENTILFVIVVGSTFAIAMGIGDAVKTVNPLYIKAARTMGVKGIALYRHVLIPAALPGLISGLKQGWSFAWRGLMAGEMLVATKGLGQVLMMGRELADISQVIVVMLVIILFGVGTDQLLFRQWESRLQYQWGLKKPA